MIRRHIAWLSLLIGLLAVAIVLWMAPRPYYKPVGVLLPAKQIRTPVHPDSVLHLRMKPSHAQLLGYIHIERRYPAAEKNAEAQIWRLAQKLAASVGANAIVVTLYRVGSVTTGHYIYVYQADALYVPGEIL